MSATPRWMCVKKSVQRLPAARMSQGHATSVRESVRYALLPHRKVEGEVVVRQVVALPAVVHREEALPGEPAAVRREGHPEEGRQAARPEEAHRAARRAEVLAERRVVPRGEEQPAASADHRVVSHSEYLRPLAQAVH